MMNYTTTWFEWFLRVFLNRFTPVATLLEPLRGSFVAVILSDSEESMAVTPFFKGG